MGFFLLLIAFQFSCHVEMVLWSLHEVSDATLGWLVLHFIATHGWLYLFEDILRLFISYQILR